MHSTLFVLSTMTPEEFESSCAIFLLTHGVLESHDFEETTSALTLLNSYNLIHTEKTENSKITLGFPEIHHVYYPESLLKIRDKKTPFTYFCTPKFLKLSKTKIKEEIKEKLSRVTYLGRY